MVSRLQVLHPDLHISRVLALFVMAISVPIFTLLAPHDFSLGFSFFSSIHLLGTLLSASRRTEFLMEPGNKLIGLCLLKVIREAAHHYLCFLPCDSLRGLYLHLIKGLLIVATISQLVYANRSSESSEFRVNS